jgi:hypothetical protein
MSSNTFGQTKLKSNFVDDSTILLVKIKQVTQNWFTNDKPNQIPSQTTIEMFDTTGKITKRIYTNNTYHKFVSDFTYDERKNVVKVKEKYFDWNPYREKHKNDTILKTSTEKYNLKTKVDDNFKQSRFNHFQTKLIRDSLGRIIQSTDTIELFGYKLTHYQYNNNGNLIEIKHFVIRHSETPELFAIDSFAYDINGQKIKEINCFDFKKKDGIEQHDKEVVTLFQYNDMGLLTEKLITTKYLSLKEEPHFNPNSNLYKYEYSFY